jgi:hypothetical protein
MPQHAVALGSHVYLSQYIRNSDALIYIEMFQALPYTTGPKEFDTLDMRRGTQPKVQGQIVLP